MQNYIKMVTSPTSKPFFAIHLYFITLTNLKIVNMKSYYSNTKLPYLFASLLMTTLLVSCGTAQSVAGSDGIYADDVEQQPQSNVVVTDQETYDDYNDNYFRKELELLGQINGTDIITDIEDYSSDDYEYEEEEEFNDDSQIGYSENAPWGYESDTDVVININTSPRWGWNTWGDRKSVV